MASEKTLTLTWTKVEFQLIMRSLNRLMPRAPMKVSSDPAVYSCPTCSTILQHQNYCSACGQNIDWDSDVQWQTTLANIFNDDVFA